jgi:uncharacterized protein (DUF1800 family)
MAKAQIIARNRFGLGGFTNDRIDDPRGWLKAQLRDFTSVPATLRDLPTRVEVASRLAETLDVVRKRAVSADGEAAAADRRKAMRSDARQTARGQYVAQAGARFRTAIASQQPFVERLVHFWANHFAVSADRLATVGLAGMLEFEAIRPNVLGRFADMLIAVEQHPAMLLYLDQAQSIGPNSLIGSRIAARSTKTRGLNENLAREILELHTLGVRSGYSQADVTEFARALTGWTVAGLGRGPAAQLFGGNAVPGSFRFLPQIHEPGPRSVLAKTYPDSGEGQARAILNDLARRPETARHVATKLARHFVADDPPPALVARLVKAYLASDGDLTTLYEALIEAPEAWLPEPTKFKTPWEWSVSAFRGLGIGAIMDQPVVAMLTELGQPIWRPRSPAGFDDVAATWAAPDALIKRLEVAQRIVSLGASDAKVASEALFGETLSPETKTAMAQVSDRQQALALLLLSPEFLRR